MTTKTGKSDQLSLSECGTKDWEKNHKGRPSDWRVDGKKVK